MTTAIEIHSQRSIKHSQQASYHRVEANRTTVFNARRLHLIARRCHDDAATAHLAAAEQPTDLNITRNAWAASNRADDASERANVYERSA